MPQQRFQDVMAEAILSLPQDMKATLRVVDDPDLGDEQRTLAAGALLHVLSGSNAIPGMRGTLAWVDDAIVLRLALERIQVAAPEVMAQQAEDSPELFGPLPDQLEAVRTYLGDLIAVLDRAVDELPAIQHEGHGAPQCASDPDESTWLYDAVHEMIIAQLDIDLDEDEVGRAVRQISTIRRPLETRMLST